MDLAKVSLTDRKVLNKAEYGTSFSEKNLKNFFFGKGSPFCAVLSCTKGCKRNLTKTIICNILDLFLDLVNIYVKYYRKVPAMIFSSIVFVAIFLPVMLLIYYTIAIAAKKCTGKGRIVQNYFLFFGSLLFYGYGEVKFVFIMLLSIFANWLFGLLIEKNRENRKNSHIVLWIMAFFNFSILFIFKYLMFTVTTVNRFLGTGFTVPKITLPIGISFFTFQAVSYVVDVYRGHGKAQKNPMNVGLYIAFFPQLIAGPIVRYETVAEQILFRRESFEKFSQGVCRFIIGMAKKMILANSMGRLADLAFGMKGNSLSAAMAWMGALAYTFQILFDFSGYSDMAIGLGKMFGFEFLENFNYPYISKSITEFWRRWHISLGTWFRDYVYIPLGGSRGKSRARLIFNLFVVWFCTGLWHGANWTFIAWGLLYFVLLSFEKMTGFTEKNNLRPLRHLYTMFFVVMGWVLFRSDSLGAAFSYVKTMFFAGGAGVMDNNAYYYFCEYATTFLLCIIASLPVKNLLAGLFAKCPAKTVVWMERFCAVWYIALFVISLSYMAKSSYNPFIYFNF